MDSLPLPHVAVESNLVVILGLLMNTNRSFIKGSTSLLDIHMVSFRSMSTPQTAATPIPLKLDS